MALLSQHATYERFGFPNHVALTYLANFKDQDGNPLLRKASPAEKSAAGIRRVSDFYDEAAIEACIATITATPEANPFTPGSTEHAATERLRAAR